jgi:hypothetical protein
MALTFPIPTSIGQTYQSGSSNTYEWTGTYWKIKNVVSYNFVNTASFNEFSASVSDRIVTATNEGQFATTGSNQFYGDQILSGTLYFNDDYNSTQAAMGMFQEVSGSGIPLLDNISKDFVILSPTSDITLVTLLNNASTSSNDVALVSLTRSGSLDVYANMMVSGSIVGDGGGLYNLPSNTNWNKDKEYILRNTEQLTFSGDYILENAALLIEGSNEEVEYSANKSFKREGTIFIGGNLLLKDSVILNNGKISVGGEVILIGNSHIEGTGTII